MNRRTLLKTLFGTSATITIPWAIPREPWEKLKSQSARLVEKWKPLITYTSNIVAPLDEHKWSDFACLLEYTERKFMKYHEKGSRALLYLIPSIRRHEGNIQYVEGETFGRKYIEFHHYMNRNDTGYWLTQFNERDYWWVELKEDYHTIRCYLT